MCYNLPAKVAPVKRLALGTQPGQGSDVHLVIPWIQTMSMKPVGCRVCQKIL